MVQVDAAKSGSFKIGGDIKINRLGFGAMRITGAGICGAPADRRNRSAPRHQRGLDRFRRG
jgi:hypothetical protein